LSAQNRISKPAAFLTRYGRRQRDRGAAGVCGALGRRWLRQRAVAGACACSAAVSSGRPLQLRLRQPRVARGHGGVAAVGGAGLLELHGECHVRGPEAALRSRGRYASRSAPRRARVRASHRRGLHRSAARRRMRRRAAHSRAYSFRHAVALAFAGARACRIFPGAGARHMQRGLLRQPGRGGGGGGCAPRAEDTAAPGWSGRHRAAVSRATAQRDGAWRGRAQH